MRDEPSRLLDALWLMTSSVFFAMGIGHMAVFCLRAVAKDGIPTLLKDATFGFVELLVGTACHPYSGVRVRAQGWLQSRGETVAAAAGVAELLGGRSVKEILALSRESFFYVSAEYITVDDLAEPSPNPELSKYAKKEKLGGIDAFVSHSWQDDSAAKWRRLQAWRDQFKRSKGREPKLWIDKYCIDQQKIDISLECLPVYLSGCGKLLILCGETYLQRLWCLTEIFVFLQMGGSRGDLEVLILPPRGSASRKFLEASIRAFDLTAATCTTEYDTRRLQRVIAASAVGEEEITALVQETFGDFAWSRNSS